MSLVDVVTTTTVVRYRNRIGAALAPHNEALRTGREAIAQLRADDGPAAAGLAEEVFGRRFTAAVRSAIEQGDDEAVSRAFYRPVVASLVAIHRQTFEDCVWDVVATHIEGRGLTPQEAGYSAALLERLDGLCMAELKDLVDPFSWRALYRWVWDEYGPTSGTVVELRRVAS